MKFEVANELGREELTPENYEIVKKSSWWVFYIDGKLAAESIGTKSTDRSYVNLLPDWQTKSQFKFSEYPDIKAFKAMLVKCLKISRNNRRERQKVLENMRKYNEVHGS